MNCADEVARRTAHTVTTHSHWPCCRGEHDWTWIPIPTTHQPLNMTTPDERTRAVLATRDFLHALTDPMRTPGMSPSVREKARDLLRQYPGHWHLEVAAVAWPSAWGAVGSGHKDAPTY